VTAGVATTARSLEREVWTLLEGVPDPEIPVLNIVDLGIVRGVHADTAGHVEVQITPTYSACPATEVIRGSVRRALDRAGLHAATIREALSPPWTSDWISDRGREKLREFGIAPPGKAVSGVRQLLGARHAACPRCNSTDTECISEFGSTPCKAHYRCKACLEPFDHFKCI
jgi:ring-1,2-phenylacetyl-CoA epoxidase subunit PaaD